MPRLNHDRPGMAYACPACDRAEIYERTGNGNAKEHPDRPFRCENCCVVLQYVIERPKKNAAHNLERQQTLTSHYDINAHQIAAKAADGDTEAVGVLEGGS